MFGTLRLTQFYLICLILLTQTFCADPVSSIIILADNEDQQTQQCATSYQESCQIKFKPSSSFTGTVEVTFKTIAEALDPAYTQNLTVLFCQKDIACDYNAQSMQLRNHSLEGSFQKDQEYIFTLSASESVNLETLITTFKISKESGCVNNNCGKNGTCNTINNKKQCVCNDGFGAKNCEAVVQNMKANSQLELSIPASSQKIIQYITQNKASDILERNQFNLIFNSDALKINIFIFDGTSQKGVFNKSYKQNTFNDSFDITKIFLNSANQQNFILMVVISNQNTIAQSVRAELKIQEISDTESTSDTYFIYFLIGMIGLIMLIIISGFIYFIFRRRLIRERAQNNLNLLAQALIQNPTTETKETESQEKYQKIFNEAIPARKMQAAVLQEIIRLNKEKINYQSKNGNANQYSSEVTNANQCICSICLQPIQENDKYRETICKHLFHIECIDVWVEKQRNCPMCRTNHKLIDLQKFIKDRKRGSVTETHQINGKGIEFEMQDNSQISSKGSDSSPLGFVPILPHSLTRQQQSQSIYQNVQELASPKKASYSPAHPPKTPLQLLQNIMNDSSNMQITIPDNTHDLTNLQLPQPSLNESSIAGITMVNNNQLLNNSQTHKKSKDDEQNNTLTKLVDIMNNNSSILNYVSNGRNKAANNQNTNTANILKPILEEEQYSAHSSQIRRGSSYNIFTDNNYNQIKSEVDLEKGLRGTCPTIQPELTSQNTEQSNQRRSTLSGIKLNYNFQIQPQVQAQFMKAQIFSPQNKNNYLFKSRITQ